MKVGILGAGAIGFATAAILSSRGHEATIWSPSGHSTDDLSSLLKLQSRGALEGEWSVGIARSIGDVIAGMDAVIIAVDADGHSAVMDMAARHLTRSQIVIVGAAHSMSALYLSKLLSERGADVPIVSWNTTAGTAHKIGPTEVDIRTIRPQIEMSVMPQRHADRALNACQDLLGDRFKLRANALEIALLSNSNPVFHVPVMLFNVTRIEHAETWAPYEQTSSAVGRTIEALDAERVALGAAFGAAIHSVNEHFHRSFGVPLDSMAGMNAALHKSKRGPKGPQTTDHRYFTQDIPYGLVFAAKLARCADIRVPAHDATIEIASVMLKRDFQSGNALWDRLALASLPKDRILHLAANGWGAT